VPGVREEGDRRRCRRGPAMSKPPRINLDSPLDDDPETLEAFVNRRFKGRPWYGEKSEAEIRAAIAGWFAEGVERGEIAAEDVPNLSRLIVDFIPGSGVLIAMPDEQRH
jgi:hypothetical protein